ncbi:EAL domain-containing protein [Anaerobacillus sp. HL2]|nr:EAL domain-containing protein [Anaerobacillus sp. HL2]
MIRLLFKIVHAEKDAYIIKAIITMAKGLDVKVLAEGVETKEQLKFVSLLGSRFSTRLV